jgi:hypothetical protein
LYYSAEETGNFYWARGVIFHGFQYLYTSDWNFKDRDNKILIGFAHAKLSQNRIMLDLNNSNPTNPQVYNIHMSYNLILGEGITLSVFLSSLNKLSKE